eukprot:6198716-Pleurochrysis_carterae.AAC.4
MKYICKAGGGAQKCHDADSATTIAEGGGNKRQRLNSMIHWARAGIACVQLHKIAPDDRQFRIAKGHGQADGGRTPRVVLVPILRAASPIADWINSFHDQTGERAEYSSELNEVLRFEQRRARDYGYMLAPQSHIMVNAGVG